MAIDRSFLIFLVTLCLLATSLSLPASIDKDTVSDVHLNAVLPEADSPSLPLRVQEQDTAAPAPAANANLELQPEEVEPVTKGPEPAAGVNNSNYFSRVITSIFEIPIAVLTAVRNLIQTTAAPKYPSSSPQ